MSCAKEINSTYKALKSKADQKHRRGIEQRVMSFEILSIAAHLYKTILICKGLQQIRSLKVIGTDAFPWVIDHFQLMLCSNNVSTLHRFGDVTTVHATTGDLEKTFIFDKTRQLNLQAMCAFQLAVIHIVGIKYVRHLTGHMTVRQVLISKSDLRCHSTALAMMPFDRHAHGRFIISLPLQL